MKYILPPYQLQESYDPDDDDYRESDPERDASDLKPHEKVFKCLCLCEHSNHALFMKGGNPKDLWFCLAFDDDYDNFAEVLKDYGYFLWYYVFTYRSRPRSEFDEYEKEYADTLDATCLEDFFSQLWNNKLKPNPYTNIENHKREYLYDSGNGKNILAWRENQSEEAQEWRDSQGLEYPAPYCVKIDTPEFADALIDKLMLRVGEIRWSSRGSTPKSWQGDYVSDPLHTSPEYHLRQRAQTSDKIRSNWRIMAGFIARAFPDHDK